MKTLEQIASFLGALFTSEMLALADPLAIASDRVDQAFQGGAANYQSYAADHPEYLAYRQAFIYLYQRNPNISKERAIQLFESWRTRFIEKYQPGDPSPPGSPGSGPAHFDLFNGACDIASTLPGGDEIGLGFIISIVKQGKEYAEFRYNREMEPIYRISSLLKQGFTIEAEREYTRHANETAAAMKQSNPNFAGFLEYLDKDSAKRTAQIIAAHPEWANTPAIQALRGLMNARGEIVATPDQLKALFGAELQNLQNTVSSNLTLLHQLAADQAILYRYMTNAQLQAQNEQRIASAQAAYEQKIKAANASVYILSTLVGFDNPELGHQMQVIGDSTIQIADAIHTFTASQASALGGVILTGNILGATMSVVSLFSGGGSSSDQQILQGIAQVREMINQLRTEMHQRFDRVDAALNQIYDTMNDRFNQIDVALGILRGDVQEIQESLYNLESDLYRIERKTFAFLDAVSRQDLNEAINGYLGYRETYGEVIPWTSYQVAENRLFTWAVNTALDEVRSGSSGRACDDASLYAELTSQPLENNLNYIAQYLTTKGWPSFTQVRLANPRDWAIAAEGTMQLHAESPMFFRHVSSNRLEQIYRVGVDLERAVTNIPSRTLFTALFTNYRDRKAAFEQELANTELEYRLGLSADLSKRPALQSLNLWGSPEQPTTWLPPLQAVFPSTNGTTHAVNLNLSLPKDWQQLVPKVCFLADLLGVGPLTLNWGQFDFANRTDVTKAQASDLYPDTTFVALFGEIGIPSFQLEVQSAGMIATQYSFYFTSSQVPDTMVFNAFHALRSTFHINEGYLLPGTLVTTARKSVTNPLSSEDFVGVPSLAAKLIRPAATDGVSRFLTNQLSSDTWSVLEDYEQNPSSAGAKFLVEFLADDLNGIIQAPIYEPHRFESVSLSPDTSALLVQNNPASTLLLNRLLLSDAYPLELSSGSTNWISAVTNPFSWGDMLSLIWNAGTTTRNVSMGTISISVSTAASTLSATNTFQQVSCTGVSNVAYQVRGRLRELQRGSYSYVLSQLSQATSLQASARDLSGAKALLEAMITLGFSQSLENDDVGRALLFGSQRVLDTEAVRELCKLGIAQSYDTNQNAKVDIAAILDERIDALETWVSNRLSQVQISGRPESLRLVSSTLNRIEAFRAGWHQSPPAPYLCSLGGRITNGVPKRMFVVWGEPNVRYTVQFSTNLTQWTDLLTPADEGEEFIATRAGRYGFYRAVLRP
jgi:hypothetical protein